MSKIIQSNLLFIGIYYLTTSFILGQITKDYKPYSITSNKSFERTSILLPFVNSEQLMDGIYTGVLNIHSNDPDQMLIELPVSMSVGSDDCANVGDVNNDGQVSILDIIKLINCILDEECGACYDLNGDDAVNIQDIILIINIILN